MSPESWVGFALLSALLVACLQLISQYFKIRAIHLMFWVRFLSVLAIAPILFVVAAPQSPLYYLYIVIASVMFAYTDLYTIGLAARSGAGVVSRLTPLGVIVTFIIWTALNPTLAAAYLANPLQTAGIIIAIGLGVYFTLRLRRCALSWEALKIMAGPILLAGVAVIFSKMAMEQAASLHRGVIYYPLVQGITVLGVYGLALTVPAFGSRLPDFAPPSYILSRRVITAGVLGASVHLGATISKYYGISLAENPAYITMVALTAPLWVLLAYRLVGYEEEADIRSGLGVVLAVVLLIFATQI